MLESAHNLAEIMGFAIGLFRHIEVLPSVIMANEMEILYPECRGALLFRTNNCAQGVSFGTFAHIVDKVTYLASSYSVP